MRLERRKGNVFLSPTGTPPSKPRTSDPTLPSWDWDSETNYESWTDIFNEMGNATREIRARKRRRRR